MTRFYVNAVVAVLMALIFDWPWGVGFFAGFLFYVAIVQ